MTAIDPDAFRAELDDIATARRADWEARQTRRQTERKQIQTARTHGLRARHTRKTARKETKP